MGMGIEPRKKCQHPSLEAMSSDSDATDRPERTCCSIVAMASAVIFSSRSLRLEGQWHVKYPQRKNDKASHFMVASFGHLNKATTQPNGRFSMDNIWSQTHSQHGWFHHMKPSFSYKFSVRRRKAIHIHIDTCVYIYHCRHTYFVYICIII